LQGFTGWQTQPPVAVFATGGLMRYFMHKPPPGWLTRSAQTTLPTQSADATGAIATAVSAAATARRMGMKRRMRAVVRIALMAFCLMGHLRCAAVEGGG
jgi:hypothetical protein